jgi:hypothetical protein
LAEQLDDYRWLMGPDGRRWLGELGPKTSATPAVISALRRELSANRVHLLLEQFELRRHARRKFPQADSMFFTRQALEQATDHWIARYKARRLGSRKAIDLCCGMGGDLQALAERGEATGVDRDAVLALLASCNAPQADVVCDDVTTWMSKPGLFDDGAAWHIDPDRRARGRRTTWAAGYEPGPQVVDELRRLCPNGAVKVAPVAELPETWREEAELEWISRDGECRQLVAWFGDLSPLPGRRRATIVDPGAAVAWTLVGEVGTPPRAERLETYVFEPDAAILAAGLAHQLCYEQRLTAITTGGGYLTGDAPITSPALATFAVLDVLPFDVKRLREALRAAGREALEIKKRGIDVDPAALRQKLRGGDGEPVVVLLAPWQQRAIAIVAKRIPRS